MKIEIEISAEKDWIETSQDVFPADGELCVLIPKYGDKLPGLAQFCQSEKINGKEKKVFLCLDELFYFLGETLRQGYEIQPTYLSFSDTAYWKPLDLPEKIDRNAKEIIFYWFGENEENDN